MLTIVKEVTSRFNNRDTEPCLLIEEWNHVRKNPQNILSFLSFWDPLTYTPLSTPHRVCRVLVYATVLRYLFIAQ
jgi:hypothetical protein